MRTCLDSADFEVYCAAHSTSQVVTDQQAVERLDPLALAAVARHKVRRLALPSLSRREATEVLVNAQVAVETPELVELGLKHGGARNHELAQQRLQGAEQALDAPVLPRAATLDAL